MIQDISKWRRLPAKGKILVSIGDCVEPNTVIGRVDYIPGGLTRVNVAQALGIPAGQVRDVITKIQGDWVDRDEIIAECSEFFCYRRMVSPKAGYINHISTVLGNAYIREPLPAGPKSTITLRADDFRLSTLQFATTLAVHEGAVVEKGRFIAGFVPRSSDDLDKSNRLVEVALPDGTVGFRPGDFPDKDKIRCILSPVFGVVTDVSLREGQIKIRPLYPQSEVRAHLRGSIAKVNSDACEVTTRGHVIHGALGYGGESAGYLSVAPLGSGAELEERDLPTDLKGRIVVTRGSVTLGALRAAACRGTSGVIVGSAKCEVVGEFLQANPFRNLGRSIEAPLTLILVQGYGEMTMPEDTYELLRSLDGQEASIDGMTQLRAGVIRPEIIVAQPNSSCSMKQKTSPLSIGSHVSIIRGTGVGRSGVIKELPLQMQRLPSGVETLTATIVDDQTGYHWITARSNLKRTQEGVVP